MKQNQIQPVGVSVCLLVLTVSLCIYWSAASVGESENRQRISSPLLI